MPFGQTGVSKRNPLGKLELSWVSMYALRLSGGF